MAYDGTDNLSQWDETRPNGATEKGKILGNAVKEIKRVVTAVIEKEHNSDGSHKAGATSGAALADDSIDAIKLKSNSVTAPKIAADAVETVKIKDAAVETAKIKDGAVTTPKLPDGAVTGPKLSNQSVDATKMKAEVTDVAKIPIVQADGSVSYMPITGAITLTAAGLVAIAANLLSIKVATVKEVQSQGVEGGTFTSGLDVVRVLNTVNDPNSMLALATNQITLQAGTYFILASVPGYGCGTHVAWWRNVTDGVDTIVGSSANASNTNPDTNESKVMDVFVITAEKVFELRHRCGTTMATSGLGKATNIKQEVYSELMLIKLL